MDQGAMSAAMSYSRRRDVATTHVTAGRPTLRRTAALQTHATQHGRQRQRSGYRPTDSLQLPADHLPDTVERRRTCFRPTDSIQLSRLTNDPTPTRSTTSAERQRRRTRFRPTDSIQLSRLSNDPTRSTTSADSSPPDGLNSALLADQRPDMVDNVGGLVSARRTQFSSPG